MHIRGEDTWDIMITLAPTSFTAPKMALAVPGTPAIPVLQREMWKVKFKCLAYYNYKEQEQNYHCNIHLPLNIYKSQIIYCGKPFDHRFQICPVFKLIDRSTADHSSRG